MNNDDTRLPPNTMGIIVSCTEAGNMDIMVGHNFGDDFDKNSAHDFEMILDGLNFMMKYQTEFLHQIGEMAMLAGKHLDDEEAEYIAEYERNQAEATEDKSTHPNVLPFPNGKPH